eukprot:5046467-Karenia_brevis.AAC.1
MRRLVAIAVMVMAQGRPEAKKEVISKKTHRERLQLVLEKSPTAKTHTVCVTGNVVRCVRCQECSKISGAFRWLNQSCEQTVPHRIHSTHDIVRADKGYLCNDCGKYGRTVRGIARGLAKPCTKKPTHAGKAVLNAFKDGRPLTRQSKKNVPVHSEPGPSWASKGEMPKIGQKRKQSEDHLPLTSLQQRLLERWKQRKLNVPN